MNRIAELRKEKHLNQSGLALKLNITQYMISAYESGRNQPSIDLLIQMASFFNVSVDYLIGKSDVRHGNIEILDENEVKCLNYFNRLNSNQKKIALGLLYSLKDYED